MATPAFHTAKGRLTPYGLACGYVEKKQIGRVITTLWAEHGVYHVREHDYGERGRLFWQSFNKLTVARKRFDLAALCIETVAHRDIGARPEPGLRAVLITNPRLQVGSPGQGWHLVEYVEKIGNGRFWLHENDFKIDPDLPEAK